MNAILLCTVGNRNLCFDGKLFGDLSIKKAFKSITKECFEARQSGDSPVYQLTLSDVMKPTLEAHKDQLAKIVLVGSNQINESETRQLQDTYWAALLLKELIADDYHLDVSVLENNLPAADADQQLEFALQLLRDLYKQHPDQELILLDTGGTPQQKQSIKLAAEFVWMKDQLKILNQSIYAANADVVENQGFRDIIGLENIIGLIVESEFESAFQVSNSIRSIKPRSLNDMLLFTAYRKDFRVDDAKYIGDKGKKVFDPDFFERFIKPYRSRKNGQEKLAALFMNQYVAPKDINAGAFDLMEKFSIAELYFQKAVSFHLFVLAIQQFIEVFIMFFLYTETGVDLRSDFENRKEMLAEFLRVHHHRLHKQVFGEEGRVPLALPSQIRIAEGLTNGNRQEVTYLIQTLKRMIYPINNRKVGLNVLRNDVAHKGKGVSEADIDNILGAGMGPGFPQHWQDLMASWAGIFGSPTENIFHQQANYIIDYIRRS